DYDLVHDDDLLYRVAFIEAFRKWGIYPRDVRTLSEESLRWHSPENLQLFPGVRENGGGGGAGMNDFVAGAQRLLRRAVLEWQPGTDGGEIFDHIGDAPAVL